MKQKQNEPDLIVRLKTLPDHRRKEGKRHPLEAVLLMIILAVMAGAKGERAVARFTKNNKKALIKALQIERKEVPSRSVIQGVIQETDFLKLQELFYGWALTIIPIKKKDFFSVDGKAIRGTVKNAQTNFHNFISLVSVFASERKQVLTASKVEIKKESEIPTVQKLLEMLDLKDITFTLDALHCQEKTLKIIKKTGNHYIVGVKNNQKKLCQDIKKMPKAGGRILYRRKKSWTDRKENREDL